MTVPSEPTSVRPSRSKLAHAAGWLSPKSMIRGVVAHPWMSVAVVLSMAIPIIVAWFPADFGSGSGGEASLDDLPMPGKVQYHNTSPGASEEKPAVIQADRHSAPTPPGRFEPGWDMPAAEQRNGQSRHAAYRDDIDSAESARPVSGTVNAVGANRPMAAQARGAWLTGVIEEPEQTPAPGMRVRVMPSRRY